MYLIQYGYEDKKLIILHFKYSANRDTRHLIWHGHEFSLPQLHIVKPFLMPFKEFCDQ